MSAQLAPMIERPPARSQHLRALPRVRRRMPRVPFLIVLGLVVGLGMLGILVLSVTIQQQSQALGDLTAQDNQLGYQQADLESQVQSKSSSTSLMAQAYALGLRPNPQPAFIDLTTGHVVGMPHRVTGTEMTDQVPASVLQQADAIAAAQSAAPKSGTAAASTAATSNPAPATKATAQAASSTPAAPVAAASAASTQPASAHAAASHPATMTTRTSAKSASSTAARATRHATTSAGGH